MCLGLSGGSSRRSGLGCTRGGCLIEQLSCWAPIQSQSRMYQPHAGADHCPAPTASVQRSPACWHSAGVKTRQQIGEYVHQGSSLHGHHRRTVVWSRRRPRRIRSLVVRALLPCAAAHERRFHAKGAVGSDGVTPSMISAQRRALPQARVQPRPPCPVLSTRLPTGARPMNGRLSGVEGLRPAQASSSCPGSMSSAAWLRRRRDSSRRASRRRSIRRDPRSRRCEPPARRRDRWARRRSYCRGR